MKYIILLSLHMFLNEIYYIKLIWQQQITRLKLLINTTCYDIKSVRFIYKPR